MLDLVRRLLTERLEVYKKDRDELLGIIKQPLVFPPGETPNYSPEIRRLIAYVDAYTDILNRLNMEPEEFNESMTDSEKRLCMLNQFLKQVPFDWPVNPIDFELGSRGISLDVVKELRAVPFSPENFGALLWIWYMELTHPATPKFDPPAPPPPDAA